MQYCSVLYQSLQVFPGTAARLEPPFREPELAYSRTRRDSPAQITLILPMFHNAGNRGVCSVSFLGLFIGLLHASGAPSSLPFMMLKLIQGETRLATFGQA